MISCQKEEAIEPGRDQTTTQCGSQTGYIHVRNTSLHTVQRLLIDNINYGSLDPGQERYVEKLPGNYLVQLIGLAGGSGCAAATVHVIPCSTDGFMCNYETGGGDH